MLAGSPSLATNVLGRYQHDTAVPLDALAGELVLVTGASGSVGGPLIERLSEACEVVATDKDSYDVTVGWGKEYAYSPKVVFHLAGAKHAPEGEADPWQAVQVNALGTANVLRDFPQAKVVVASTCKACDPETAYGASKLLAERMVLNAGGGAARFFNVVDTSGNVFETWRATEGPLPVTDCDRYFISLEEAVSLLLWAAVLPSGRYVWDPGFRRAMAGVARQLYPDREQVVVPRRRGDRRVEPLHAAHERLHETDVVGLWRVSSPHDPS